MALSEGDVCRPLGATGAQVVLWDENAASLSHPHHWCPWRASGERRAGRQRARRRRAELASRGTGGHATASPPVPQRVAPGACTRRIPRRAGDARWQHCALSNTGCAQCLGKIQTNNARSVVLIPISVLRLPQVGGRNPVRCSDTDRAGERCVLVRDARTSVLFPRPGLVFS